MDQLWSALIAGVAALLGALVGGYFARAGAISGAEVAARAATQQLAQQQAHEVRHWIRQERKADYEAVMRAYGQFSAHIAKYRIAVGTGQDASAMHSDLDDVFQDLAVAAGALHMLGPQEVWQAADDLRAASLESLRAHREFAVQRAGAYEFGDIPWGEIEWARAGARRAQGKFAAACRETLENSS
ncbi:hypothetical protein [Streptomyces sp. NPDC005549]|uniref:hypothetical protein n=1 Tax=Streptomyces sp. NPDC005549 TaxID=3154888 RepID=UPI0033A39E20